MGEIIIKCFETPGGKYFYDRHTNSIIKVNEDEYLELLNIEKNLPIEKQKLLEKFTVQNLLKCNIVEKIQHPETKNIHYLTNYNMSQLILQVTQQCNLRCEYCAYSGNYYNRKHTTQRMNWDIAKKSIDFYYQHSKETDKFIISFYGGEPLLEFNLIKECVTYAHQKANNKQVEFHMTTNGTLLTDEICKYLINHNFYITISLDGDETEHDRNRKFRNGTGTFATILKNLDFLINYDVDYYESYVGFNTVLNPKVNVKNVLKYFSSDYRFKKNRVTLNEVSPTGIKNKNDVKFDTKFWNDWKYEYLRLLLYMIGRLEIQDINPLMLQYESPLKEKYKELKNHDEIQCLIHHSGPCVPGVRRVMVTTTGDIFPCERVSECLECAKIGTIEHGFDEVAISKILNCGKITEEECKKCWNLVHCSICIGNIDPVDNQITKNSKLESCQRSKINTWNTFRRLCVLLENGYHIKIGEKDI